MSARPTYHTRTSSFFWSADLYSLFLQHFAWLCSQKNHCSMIPKFDSTNQSHELHWALTNGGYFGASGAFSIDQFGLCHNIVKPCFIVRLSSMLTVTEIVQVVKRGTTGLENSVRGISVGSWSKATVTGLSPFF